MQRDSNGSQVMMKMHEYRELKGPYMLPRLLAEDAKSAPFKASTSEILTTFTQADVIYIELALLHEACRGPEGCSMHVVTSTVEH